ncbi:quinone oxidoreductase [Marinimicrobium sp. ABcell2]|uniref:quinone oxidoreductase family protein n=1 Tax=Marinimicrobium sp. ABcell2 TaxID=3069751 RepID=UPI0027B3EA82|nr:quinone oxidoreductase [Marinimicrobium sp. ABcell2]MDQ2077857.1 quinone oxidoreductase [Marinimicrobium sp. ABcell2]
MSHHKSYRFQEPGDESVLKLETRPIPEPQAGEVRVRHTAIGVNFIDIYHRTGLYPLPLPSGLGLEAAGVVDAVGEGVTSCLPGDRVAYCGGPPGAYGETHVVAADKLLALPDAVSDEQAAAALLKGLTAAYLLFETFAVRAGQTILWHAAAGGVGSIACQWAKALGVRVIGTAGSDEKLELARQNGCAEVIDYRQGNIAERVRALTSGQGVPVVYDSVGRATFEASLDCLSPRGLMVSFGNASGAVPDFSPLLLAQKGSLFLTRPTLGHYTSTREELESLASRLFDAIGAGDIRVPVNQRYSLDQAAQAHRDLAQRKTTGSSILIP